MPEWLSQIQNLFPQMPTFLFVFFVVVVGFIALMFVLVFLRILWSIIRLIFGSRSSNPMHPNKNGIEGVALDVQRRTEQIVPWISAGPGERTVQILEFQLEQYDSNGNRVRIVPVEMRGPSIVGFISNGHKVLVHGKMKNGLLQAKQIHDLTSEVIVYR